MRRTLNGLLGFLLPCAMIATATTAAAQLDTASKQAANNARTSAPASGPSAADLTPFTSAEGRFSVMMPGAPKADSSAVPVGGDKSGQSTTIYHFIVTTNDGNVGYMVSYNDYTAAEVSGTPQEILQRTQDATTSGDTVLTGTAIDLQGVPGRAFSYRDPDGSTYDERQYYLGMRLYQLIVYAGKGFTAKDDQAFLNSFAINNGDMQPFASADGRFTVMMPGAPKTGATPQAIGRDNSGLSTTMYSFSVSAENDNVAYLVCYNDYPPGVADDGAVAVLQRVRDAVVAQNTVLNDSAVELNGVTGRQFAYRTADGTTFYDRDFSQGRRLYQLIVVTGSGFTAKDADAFMSSFAITGK